MSRVQAQNMLFMLLWIYGDVVAAFALVPAIVFVDASPLPLWRRSKQQKYQTNANPHKTNQEKRKQEGEKDGKELQTIAGLILLRCI
jgi:hypothetical protein